MDTPTGMAAFITALQSNLTSANLWGELASYDPESCRLVGRIVNVSADESVLGETGKVDPAKLRPITFDPMNNTYVVLGETVGQAFKDGAKLK